MTNFTQVERFTRFFLPFLHSSVTLTHLLYHLVSKPFRIVLSGSHLNAVISLFQKWKAETHLSPCEGFFSQKSKDIIDNSS